MRSKERYYLYRIYALLKLEEINISFKKFRKKRGETDTIAAIYLNPEKEILPTFVHECLHILYPEWSESRILRTEKSVFNSLSDKQLKSLLAYLSDALNQRGGGLAD